MLHFTFFEIEELFSPLLLLERESVQIKETFEAVSPQGKVKVKEFEPALVQGKFAPQ